MCGITAYAGNRPARELLLTGLEHLEYRGYDSAGVALQRTGGDVHTVRAVGPLAALRDAVGETGGDAVCGIGHTRWATHGGVTEANAHPHADHAERVHVVLNGIVENHAALREGLGPMRSQTDAEVVAHLIGREPGPLHEAARRVNDRLAGHFSYVAMCTDEPGVIVGTRRETPMVVGVGEGETFLASAIPAFLDETRAVIELEDGEVARATARTLDVFGPHGEPRRRAAETVDWSVETAEREGFDSFMLKEIHEQPDALAATLALPPPELRRPARIIIVGCGTSLHAGLIGRDALEAWAGIPTGVEVASEWHTRPPLVGPGDLVIAVTQSGETADTLAAMRTARAAGATVAALTNVCGSQATREADVVIDTHAGIEIGVAATKTFTTQVAALLRIALAFSDGSVDGVAEELRVMPALVADVIERARRPVAAAANRWAGAGYFLFLGRHAGYPVALEGALKLKEVAYVAADAYPAGEMKHGPIALIEDGTPVICVATASPVLEKLASNVAEVQARGADVLSITTVGDAVLDGLAMPRTHPLLQPLLSTIPLQLLAHEIATRRGLDVDRPRNLAKTVTVE
jgi:glucosamine--fructose-6-phosphate aminotransferase (isomerizing)